MSRRIGAPADTVWNLLTDLDSYSDWNRAVVSIHGSIDEGATIHLVSIAYPESTFTPMVTELDAPTRMVWSDGMPLGLFNGRREAHLGPRRALSAAR